MVFFAPLNDSLTVFRYTGKSSKKARPDKWRAPLLAPFLWPPFTLQPSPPLVSIFPFLQYYFTALKFVPVLKLQPPGLVTWIEPILFYFLILFFFPLFFLLFLLFHSFLCKHMKIIWAVAVVHKKHTKNHKDQIDVFLII